MSKEGLKVVLSRAKALINEGKSISFGSPVGEQVNLLDKGVLSEHFDGSEASAKLAMLDSMLCYVEVPSGSWRNGEKVLSYDKYLATRNEEVMKVWLSVDELPERYTRNLSKVAEKGYYFLVKPNSGTSKEENIHKISVPTKPVNLESSDVRVYPVPVLVYLFEKIKKELKSSVLELGYFKDNRTSRVMVSTCSKDILMGIYGDESLIDGWLSSVTDDWKSTKQLERGYCRLVEADSSRWDMGVRSLNLARLSYWREIPVEDIDTSFVDVDLNGVTSQFSMLLRKMTQTSLHNLAKVLGDWKYKYSGGYSVYDLESWVLGKEAIHSTTFRKDLHDLMVSCPSLFEGYDGKKADPILQESVAATVISFEDADGDFSLFD